MNTRFFRLCQNKEDHRDFINYIMRTILVDKKFEKGMNDRFNEYPCYISIRPSPYGTQNGVIDGWMPFDSGYNWYVGRDYQEVGDDYLPVVPHQSAVFMCFKTDEQFLMIRRKDGSWGFPGGKVEPNETFQKAIVREVKEEIGVNFHSRDLSVACSHNVNNNMTSHLYVKDVQKHFLLTALVSSVNGLASHAHETTGAALFNIKDFKTDGMTFAPTVLEELKEVFGV